MLASGLQVSFIPELQVLTDTLANSLTRGGTSELEYRAFGHRMPPVWYIA